MKCEVNINKSNLFFVKQHNYISILTLVWLPWKQRKKKKKEGSHVIRKGKYLSHQINPTFFKKQKHLYTRDFPFHQDVFFPLQRKRRLEKISHCEELNRETNKCFSSEVITCFQELLPIWIYRNLPQEQWICGHSSLEWKWWSAGFLFCLL